jgi:glycosyltransferase involved in cell wall biosynthesis
MKVLALEPYYGGSHRAFLDGWQTHSGHEWTTHGLPPNWWKWRMRHSPITLAANVRKQIDSGEKWDAIVCSDMLNLAEFRGLAPPSLSNLPTIVYCHENQWTYPTQTNDPRDHHYGFNNFVTALAADAVWFNTQFHRDEFLSATRAFLKKMPDHPALETVDEIESKSSIQSPGVASLRCNLRQEETDSTLHITWAARWEFDKDPDTFFAALRILKSAGTSFRLSVLGESFRDRPAIFETAEKEFADNIVRWGFADSKEDYIQTLKSTDIFVSTAQHEFFGISVVEALACGAYPLLPNRLAYPEVLQIGAFPDRKRYLYDGDASSLASRVTSVIESWHDSDQYRKERTEISNSMTRFHWPLRAAEMDSELERICTA